MKTIEDRAQIFLERVTKKFYEGDHLRAAWVIDRYLRALGNLASRSAYVAKQVGEDDVAEQIRAEYSYYNASLRFVRGYMWCRWNGFEIPLNDADISVN